MRCDAHMYDTRTLVTHTHTHTYSRATARIDVCGMPDVVWLMSHVLCLVSRVSSLISHVLCPMSYVYLYI